VKHSHGRGRHGNPKDVQAYIHRLRKRSRAKWQMPDRIVSVLGLKRGWTVGDVGCGAGYFSERLAKKVGPSGRVFACDVEPVILSALRRVVRQAELRNVTPVLCGPADPMLPPKSCHRIVLINVLHHYSDTRKFLRALRPALKPGGRIVNVDFVKRELPIGPPPSEKLSRESFLRQARACGYRLVCEHTFLPYQYFLELTAR